MNSIRVFVEIGKKKVFAGAVDWPGWCRSGPDEESALLALIDYGPRYAQVLQSKEIDFKAPTDTPDLIVVERHDGNTTTDFGAPSIMLEDDREPLDRMEFERLQTLLVACWGAFDRQSIAKRPARRWERFRKHYRPCTPSRPRVSNSTCLEAQTRR